MKLDTTRLLTGLLGLFFCLGGAVLAQDERANELPKADAAAAAVHAAKDALARFAKDGNPDGWEHGRRNWKMRMECLVQLAKAGPDAVPVLVEALQAEAPFQRGFAAQALAFLADPSAQPALEQLFADPEWRVQLLAVKALSRIGKLDATPDYLKIAEKAGKGVDLTMRFALERDDEPDSQSILKALADYDLSKMDSAEVGRTAPELTLPDASGKTYTLDQFRGNRSVVLTFLQHPN